MATLKRKLTKRVVDSLDSSGDQRDYVWDSDLPGFGLVLYPSGRRVYVVDYRTHGGRKGRKRRITLGQHGKLTAEEPAKARD